MKRIYTYLLVKCNIHVHVEINFKHLNTYVQGDICSHTELLSFYICTILQYICTITFALAFFPFFRQKSILW